MIGPRNLHPDELGETEGMDLQDAMRVANRLVESMDDVPAYADLDFADRVMAALADEPTPGATGFLLPLRRRGLLGGFRREPPPGLGVRRDRPPDARSIGGPRLRAGRAGRGRLAHRRRDARGRRGARLPERSPVTIADPPGGPDARTNGSAAHDRAEPSPNAIETPDSADAVAVGDARRDRMAPTTTVGTPDPAAATTATTAPDPAAATTATTARDPAATPARAAAGPARTGPARVTVRAAVLVAARAPVAPGAARTNRARTRAPPGPRPRWPSRPRRRALGSCAPLSCALSIATRRIVSSAPPSLMPSVRHAQDLRALDERERDNEPRAGDR